MAAGKHEMPPHLQRYLDGLSDPGTATEPPAPGDGARFAVTPGSDLGQYLTAAGEPPGAWFGQGAADLGLTGQVDPATARALFRDPGAVLPALAARAAPAPTPQGHQEAGHVDPADHARWRQAQTELAGMIRTQNRGLAHNPEAARTMPASLSDWMAARAAELEQAEASEPEIELPG